mmetsp:Transcript_23464/g.51469  ORF Transcript_23464/g.51469 Transcript_23464/m.51469 type:complete len:117 (-) Transcript_23464:258-608(-)
MWMWREEGMQGISRQFVERHAHVFCKVRRNEAKFGKTVRIKFSCSWERASQNSLTSMPRMMRGKGARSKEEEEEAREGRIKGVCAMAALGHYLCRENGWRALGKLPNDVGDLRGRA